MMTREEVATLVQAKLAYSGSARLRAQVWTDVLSIYEEALGPSARGVDVGTRLWGIARGRRMVRFAVVVLLVCGLAVLVRYGIYQGAPSQSKSAPVVDVPRGINAPESIGQPVLMDEELDQARRLFEGQDLAGLVGLLEIGRPETQIRVAEYLGQIGDLSAVSTLQSLAAEWSGPAEDNPFERAVEAIREREAPAESSPTGGDGQSNDANAGAPGAVEPGAGPRSEQESARVAGSVVDGQRRLPIPGAVVGFRSGGKAVADAQGRFDLACAGSSSHTLYLYASAPGYAAGMIATPTREGMVPEVTIALDPGSRLIGTIIDPNGTPIEGASVNVVGLQSLDWTFSTDASGQFEVDGLNPTVRGYSVYVVHPAYPSLMASIQPAPAGQTLRMRFVLKGGVVLFGQVTDSDGCPVAGATVGNTGSGLLWKCDEVRTDEYGMYQLGFLHTGDHTLWVTHGRYAPFVGHARLRPGETERRVDIQLTTGRELHGRVVDDRGHPVAEAVIRIQTYETIDDLVGTDRVCDPNGYFTIPNAPDQGKLRLLVRGDGIVSTAHEVDFAQDECLITAPRPGRIYGQVLDALTGEPIPRFTVKMDFSKVAPRSATFASSWSEEGHVFDSADGFFDTGMEGLPVGGTLLMSAHAEGYDPVKIDPVVVLPIGEGPARTAFRLPPAVVFAGRVIATNGRPISQASVLFFSKENLDDAGEHPSAVTDAAGVFAISGLGPWEIQYVRVSAAGFGSRVCAMSDLLEGPGWLSDIMLEPAATLVGCVVDAEGNGVVNAQVRARLSVEQSPGEMWHPPGLGPSTRTDEDGYYRLSGLPGGSVSVSVVFDESGRIRRKFVDLVSGETTVLDFADDGGSGIDGH